MIVTVSLSWLSWLFWLSWLSWLSWWWRWWWWWLWWWPGWGWAWGSGWWFGLFVCRCCCCGDSFYGPWEISGATECDHVEPRDSQASQPEIQGMLGTICWYVIMAANLVRNSNIMQKKNPGKNNMTYKSTNWFKKDLQETMVNTCSYHKFNKGFLWNVPSSSIIQFSEQVEEWCTCWVNELIILSPTTFIMAEMRPSMLTLHSRHMFFCCKTLGESYDSAGGQI